jgi:hypothetical protein
VFRTEKCGIDLSFVTPTVAADASDIFITGELGWDGADLQDERSRNTSDRVHPGKNGTPLSWMS